MSAVAIGCLAVPALVGAQRAATPSSAVHTFGEPGLVAPRPLTEVAPKYTVRARRERIEGAAMLSCVVGVDGRITECRVERSLDAVSGLDDQAIAAARDWTFTPGSLDGQPVPVRVRIEMGFSLREGGRMPRVWPEGFPDDTMPREETAGRWQNVALSAAGLTVTLAHPPDWQPNTVPVNTRLAEFQHRTRFSVSTVDLFRPQAMPFEIRGPIPANVMDLFADRMRDQLTALGRSSRVVDRGQVQSGSRRWMWVDLLTDVPQDAIYAPYVAKEMHLWIFATTEGRQAVAIFSSVLPLITASAEDARAEIENGAAVVQEMLKRFEIAPAQ